jgi:hypothetical protein
VVLLKFSTVYQLSDSVYFVSKSQVAHPVVADGDGTGVYSMYDLSGKLAVILITIW